MYRRFDEIDRGSIAGPVDDPPGGGDPLPPRILTQKWLDITWPWSGDVSLTRTLTGFEVGVVVGTVPETDPWLVAPFEVGPDERRAVRAVALAADLTTVHACIRPIYGDRKGPWTVQGVAQSVVAVPVALATRVLVDEIRLDTDAAAAAAADAQTAANNAATAAAAAQTAANNANAALADIAADGKLTPSEKQSTRLQWDTILGERAGIQSRADAVSVSRTGYDSAFQTLATYLNAGTTWSSGTPSWLADANLSTTTPIDGPTFRANWKALFDARQALLNAITAAAQTAANNAATAASSAQSTANSAASAAAYADRLARSGYNLIKNGNSEDANPTGIEALCISTVNPRNGSKCRSFASGYSLTLSAKIPCSQGDQFIFQLWSLCDQPSDAHLKLRAQFYNAAGAAVHTPEALANPYWTGYQQASLSSTAPAGAVSVEFAVCAHTGSGVTYWVDDIYACRMIAAGMLEADAIQTTNYAEDGSGNPTAGARMDISGTALKVMPGGLRIGPYIFSDYFWRILQALDGGSGSRTIYRGNIDTATRGGAPDIARLTLTRRKWNTTDHMARLELAYQPTIAADNLDAMRRAEIKLYRQSAVGTTANLTLVDTYFLPLTDRLYRNFSSDSDGLNVALATFETVDAAISAGYPAALVSIHNAYGPSDSNCFYSSTGAADGVALTNNGTTWPFWLTGGTAGSIGGGGGSAGGGCPAPWVQVQLASGLLVDAADLYDGAQVAAIREQDGQPTVGTLRDVQTIWRQRVALILEDGSAPEFSRGHRVATVSRGWVAVQDLRPGDLLVAQQEARVRGVRPAGLGQVVSFRVEGAGTYFAGGILHHNAKTEVDRQVDPAP